MTKEITKAYILQQIQDKFKLRELEPEVFRFLEAVVPVYNIEQHLTEWECKQEMLSITATGAYVYFTVPDNEQWTLRAYYVLFYNEGAYKVSGLYVSHRPLVEDSIYLDLEKEQTGTYIVNLPVPVILQPGNKVNIFIDTFVSVANLRVIVDVQVEELR